MGFFNRLVAKIKGVDPFYDEIPTEHIALYQHYFNKIISAIDVETQTRWSLSKEYDKQQFDKDEEIMSEIILNEAARENLSPAMLQVMLNQYFFADLYQRELEKDCWVKRVMFRKNPDYFPSGSQVRKLLEEVS